MKGKRQLYRGKKNLDYENVFSDKNESLERIKKHIRKVKESSRKENI